jgi:hypothetical protein
MIIAIGKHPLTKFQLHFPPGQLPEYPRLRFGVHPYWRHDICFGSPESTSCMPHSFSAIGHCWLCHCGWYWPQSPRVLRYVPCWWWCILLQYCLVTYVKRKPLPTLRYVLILHRWVSNNVQPDYKRSVAISMLISLANASGMASSQIYPIKDAPRYIKGNAISLGGEVIALFCIGLIYALLKYRMRQKEKLLASGHCSNGKEGDRSLDFKYVF